MKIKLKSVLLLTGSLLILSCNTETSNDNDFQTGKKTQTDENNSNDTNEKCLEKKLAN
ncbi:hypothetical protein [uncultured Treponema sp.]|uniref:hypothetical protein n=1 Tax=uncultured Treponema sp. TaxID=162155 RepID=UPI00260155D0|nr:hypothetical protein [uncultured Treponema sp.]